MSYITPSQVTAKLAPLFDPQAPTSLRCFSVLAGSDIGKILTDEPDNPRWGAVWEPGDGGLYLAGALDAATIRHIVTTLRHDGDVVVQFWHGDPIVNLLPPDPEYVGDALEFLDRPAGTADLEAIVRQLPAGYSLHRMNHALLKRSLWCEDTIRRHGSAEAFLARSLAVCLMHGDTMLCEASTGPSIKGVRELGVITHEQHRGRGLATITCAYLIQLCAQVGDCTYWNCSATNLASTAVARKLGYRTEREYRLFAWFKSGL